MDGVGHDDDGILVLGATNIPWQLDPAVRRRFQKKIYIPLPDEIALQTLFKLQLKGTPHSVTDDDIENLATMCEGYSGSDIHTLVQDAIYEPLRTCSSAQYFKIDDSGFYEPCAPSEIGAIKMDLNDIKDSTKLKPPSVCLDDIYKALTKIKPTVSQKDLEQQEEFTEEFGQEG
jgi:vacuolar protein-sorting-associated protein 4